MVSLRFLRCDGWRGEVAKVRSTGLSRLAWNEQQRTQVIRIGEQMFGGTQCVQR